MKTRALRTAVLGATLLFAGSTGTALAAAGDLDPSFDGDGKALVTDAGVGRDVRIQPDGKIVVAGTTKSKDFGVWRFNPDGSPDSGFDGDGAAAVDFGGRDEVVALALQPNGRILVAGFTRTGVAEDDVAVARFDPDGDLDRSFNYAGPTAGTLVLPSPTETQHANAVAVQPDGKIVVAGYAGAEYLVVRLDESGTPDSTTYQLDGYDGLTAIQEATVQPDGKLVAAGSGGVARFNTDGSLDTTFGTMGVAPPLGPEAVDALLLQPDGHIVIAGASQRADPRSVVARLTTAGKPDETFSDDGTASPDFAGQDVAVGVGLQADGKLVVAASTTAGYDFAAARLSANGVLDPSYGAGGKTTLDLEENAAAGGAALQPDGRLVISGATQSADPSVVNVAVARVLGDPPPDQPKPEPDPEPDPQPAPAQLCAGQAATIVGTRGADTLRGTRGPDVIAARGGNDRVVGARGNDVVCGGRGRDRLSGGRGADVLLAGAGRDRCKGGPARDRARGCETRQSL
jgi:uncharacterized delta-60 repeat protein